MSLGAPADLFFAAPALCKSPCGAIRKHSDWYEQQGGRVPARTQGLGVERGSGFLGFLDCLAGSEGRHPKEPVHPADGGESGSLGRFFFSR